MTSSKITVQFSLEKALEAFEVQPALLGEVMAAGLEGGGEFCELYFQYSHSTAVFLDDHAVRGGNLGITRGVGIRVLKGDQTGFSHTADLSRPSLLKAARTAGMIASSGKSGTLAPWGSTVLPVLPDLYPSSEGNVDIPGMKDFLDRLDKEVFALDPRVVKSNASIRARKEQVLIVNSEGLAVCDDRPQSQVFVNCVAESKGQKEENYSSIAWRTRPGLFLDDALLKRMAKEVVEKTVRLFESVEAPGGEMPLVLGAGEGGILIHEAMGHGFEADFIRKGTSIFAGRLDQTCASKEVTIFDSGINPGEWGSLRVDDEGCPGQATVLVDAGRLNSWMHDRLSARHFNTSPTGNGRRQNYQCLPLPRMRSTYLAPGPHAPEDIIKSVKKGIYAAQFTNGQVNIGPGDFTFYMKSGWLIEDGKLTQPVKDVNIIGNGPKVLSELEMVGNDLKIPDSGGSCGKNGQSVPVSYGMPTLKVKSITVGGRS